MARLVAAVEHNANRAILILILAQSVLIFLDVSAKWLAITGMPTGEIMFARYGVHVSLLLVFVLPLRGWSLFATGNWKLEVARGFCLLASTGGNFLSMRYLPLTITGALLFTSPLMICALSGPLLGETVGWRRWLAIAVGFVGILIIIRPGTEAFHPAALLSLMAAFFAALFSIVTRKLAGVDGAMTQQIYAGGIALIVVTPFAFTDFAWPSQPISWVAFFTLGTAGVLGHLLISVAHRYATPATLAPFNYLQLLYLALASWLVFNQPPDNWFALGASIIILSGLYIWLRERALHKATTSVDEAVER
uniref:DMT family transporter n=1 Tax=Devosia sp. YR412 TaxID=1881030 RepID=UPI0008D8601F|nr:DMT family transporter [Devosia sp. YR412]SEP76135.1 Threonine/homoserine efflux transporter RhtA [Devosia sp. YR412]